MFVQVFLSFLEQLTSEIAVKHVIPQALSLWVGCSVGLFCKLGPEDSN